MCFSLNEALGEMDSKARFSTLGVYQPICENLHVRAAMISRLNVTDRTIEIIANKFNNRLVVLLSQLVLIGQLVITNK